MDEIRNTLCHIRYLSREIYGLSDYLKRKQDEFEGNDEEDLELVNSVAGNLEFLLDELNMYYQSLSKRERDTWNE